MMSKYIEDYAKTICENIERMIVTDINGNIIDAAKGLNECVEKAYEIKEKKQGLIFFCGNGASATMAEHMSHDWFQNAQINTYSVSETSHLTAISNDISYEDVFAYRINRICSERDMLVTISSSGNSPNVIKAIEAAKAKGAYVITISGMKIDNKSRRMGNLNFYVPLDFYGMVESAHAVLLHSILDCFLDKYMGGRH